MMFLLYYYLYCYLYCNNKIINIQINNKQVHNGPGLTYQEDCNEENKIIKPK